MNHTVLSIQSHVVYGHVGNRSAVFPLERLGIEVLPINTVQLSSHTGRPGWKGMVFPGTHIEAIIHALQDIHVLNSCTAVLSGYIGDTSIGNSILHAVNAVKRLNPEAVYCCDPVMGDAPGGLYVHADIPAFFERHALSLADIITPNHFEAELLSGISIRNEADALRAASILHGKGPRIVLITSYKPRAEESVGFFLSDGGLAHVIETPRIPFPSPPKGSGDLVSALFLGRYLQLGNAVEALEAAANSIWAILDYTKRRGTEEIALIGAQDLIIKTIKQFHARRVS